MKKLHCNISMFSLDQTILLVDTTTYEVSPLAVATLETLPEFLAAAAYENEVYNISLHGEVVFCDEVKDSIQKVAQRCYAFENKELEIEVI